MNIRKKKSKLLQKKLIKLKINPLNNNKFLQLIVETEHKIRHKKIAGKLKKKTIILHKFYEIAKQRRDKFHFFIKSLVKANRFFQKYKPYTFNHYDVSKFASQGNSFKKNFKKDLFLKKIFNHFYGNFQKKYLKKQMTEIHQAKQIKNSRNYCVEFFESRLDSVLYRAKLCSSIKDARQIIAHGHILVNRAVKKNYSYSLIQGDLVQVNRNAQSRKIIKAKYKKQLKERFDSIFWPFVPSYVSINYRTFDIIFGKIKNFNFSSSFTFKNNYNKVVENHYYH